MDSTNVRPDIPNRQKTPSLNKIRIFKDRDCWCVYLPFDESSGWEALFSSYGLARAYAIHSLEERQLYYERKGMHNG